MPLPIHVGSSSDDTILHGTLLANSLALHWLVTNGKWFGSRIKHSKTNTLLPTEYEHAPPHTEVGPAEARSPPPFRAVANTMRAVNVNRCEYMHYANMHERVSRQRELPDFYQFVTVPAAPTESERGWSVSMLADAFGVSEDSYREYLCAFSAWAPKPRGRLHTCHNPNMGYLIELGNG